MTELKLPRRFAVDHARVVLDTGTESPVQQSMKDETDINVIMAKYRKTGLLEHVNRYQGDYGDFTQAPESYHDAYNRVLAADEMFLDLPAQIRSEFNNDPGAFLAFAENPANEDRMRELGLLPSKRAAEQPPARSEPDTGTPSAASGQGSPEPPAASEAAPEAPAGAS